MSDVAHNVLISWADASLPSTNKNTFRLIVRDTLVAVLYDVIGFSFNIPNNTITNGSKQFENILLKKV